MSERKCQQQEQLIVASTTNCNLSASSAQVESQELQKLIKQHPLNCSNGKILDEDLQQSYWSDSAASNCDQISSPSSASHYNRQHSSSASSIKTEEAPTTAPGRCDGYSLDTRQIELSQTTSPPTNSRPTAGRGGRSCNIGASGVSSSTLAFVGANGGRNVRKRVMANERERERTKSLNQALEILRNKLPVAEAEKRSKIQTLRMAKEYIEFLTKFKNLSQQQQQQQHIQADEPQIGDVLDRPNQQFGQQLSSPKLIPPANEQDRPLVHQPDSPLTYKFYKFRLKSQTRGD